MSNYNFAFVFPGQGSQSINMLGDFYQDQIIQDYFDRASAVLGYNLLELIKTDEGKLNQTEYTQPALLVSSVALFKLWQSKTKAKPSCLAGHSLGELSALACAGAINFDDAVALVQLRGKLMQECPQGSMAAILGLTDEQVIDICNQVWQQTNQVISAANFNCPGQVVIAGEKSAVIDAIELAKTAGARRALPLKVSVASHSNLMAGAADKFNLALSKVSFNELSIPVINNYKAIETTPETMVESLTKQLISPVRWGDSIKYLVDKYKINSIFECGPGKVLTGLNKRISSQTRAHSMDSIDSLKQTLEISEGTAC